jgi:hypothetical protein
MHAAVEVPVHRDEVSGLVRWDERDRFIFNRGADHVVSMALIDALLSRASRSGVAPSFGMEFNHFGELTAPIVLHAVSSRSPSDKTWEFRQTGRVIARARTSGQRGE